MIVTKSASRFAQNTVDSLTAVRNPKDTGGEVFFEKENSWTFASKGEPLITFMPSLAQEESCSISENLARLHRRAFAGGKVMVPHSSFLGYKKGENGRLVIDEGRSVIARRIYSDYLRGDAPAKSPVNSPVRGFLLPGECQTKRRWNAPALRDRQQRSDH